MVAMLLLVLISAVGIYVVSLPYPVGQSLLRYQQETVARNMARAGAHAAIARLPQVIPEDTPYIRYIPSGRNLRGKYAVSSWKSGAGGSTVEEFVVSSEGTVAQAGDVKHRVRAVVRYSAREGRGRIVLWEDLK